MKGKFIIALDQGTTSSRAVLFNEKAEIQGIAQQEFRQMFPKPGWVEHDPTEILNSQLGVLTKVIQDNQIKAGDIAAIGVTNQRETTVIWDRKTGLPIFNAIVWQDKRTAYICEELKAKGLEDYVRQNTGLVIDSYFSATKVKWILDQVEGARERAARGELAFGTIDTWLIWNMTNGKVHTTDYTNASRTMLYNIRSLKWDDKLLKVLGVPPSLLPEVLPSAANFGSWNLDGVQIPICGVAGDQQAALFGQACFEPGMAKNTYGTGCFLVCNTGPKRIDSKHGLLTTLACGPRGEPVYALEGSVFIAGAVVQWLRDSLRIIGRAEETETLARSIASTGGVYCVPAFVGLGAPYWDMGARGAIVGLTRGAGRAEIARAALEAIAYQTRDVVEAMQADGGLRIRELRVDGGAVVNDFLMQFQADILGARIVRPRNIESTSLGAALLAGLGAGFWSEPPLSAVDRVFTPKMPARERESLYAGWKAAVARVRG